VMRAAVDAALDDASYDAVVVAIGSSAETYPQLAVQPIVEALEARKAPKPVAVFVVPHSDDALARFAAANIAAFRTPEACAEAVALRLEPIGLPRRPVQVRPTVSESLTRELTRGPGTLTEALALDLFDAVGIDTTRRVLIPITELAATGERAGSLRPPLVVKLVSRDLPHKSDVGAVRLGIAGPEGIAPAIEEMRSLVRRTARTPGSMVSSCKNN